MIGSLIAVIFVGMVGYAGFQHHRQKQLAQEEKEGIGAMEEESKEAERQEEKNARWLKNNLLIHCIYFEN